MKTKTATEGTLGKCQTLVCASVISHRQTAYTPRPKEKYGDNCRKPFLKIALTKNSCHRAGTCEPSHAKLLEATAHLQAGEPSLQIILQNSAGTRSGPYVFFGFNFAAQVVTSSIVVGARFTVRVGPTKNEFVGNTSRTPHWTDSK